MLGKLTVGSWVAIREGCQLSYYVKGSAETDFYCGDPADGFEFAIEAEALREFLRLGTEALREMDARFAREQAERAEAANAERAEAAKAEPAGG